LNCSLSKKYRRFVKHNYEKYAIKTLHLKVPDRFVVVNLCP